MTGLYNVLEKLKAGEPLSEKDENVKTRGRVLILKELHERIDAATFRAYGWPDTLTDEEILARLVALNAERAAEEARGHVRWLRPDYQIPRFGRPQDRTGQIEAALEASVGPAKKPAFPKSDLEQSFAVHDLVAASPAPLTAADIAAQFRQGRRIEKQVEAVLVALERMGRIAPVGGSGGSPGGGSPGGYVARRAA